MGLDHFFFSLHPRFIGTGKESHLCYQFINADELIGPKTVVKNGPYGERISRSMRRGLKAIADQQIHLVIDELLFDEDDFCDYLELFKEVDLFFVAIKPPQHIAESWEKKRGDRKPGLARGLYESVYGDRVFDLEIDSSKMSPRESAQAILDYVRDHPQPKAFKENARRRV